VVFGLGISMMIWLLFIYGFMGKWIPLSFFFAELEGLQLAFDFNSKEYDPTSFLGDFWFNLDPWLVIDEV
jgi:hypothetical protein